MRAPSRFASEHGGPLGGIERFEHTTSLTNHSVRQWEVMEWVHDARAAHEKRAAGAAPAPKKGGDAGDVSRQSGKRARSSASSPPLPSPALAGGLAWVALDDDESLTSDARHAKECAPHAVQVDCRTGLTDADADAAIAILLGAPPGAQPEAGKERGLAPRPGPSAAAAKAPKSTHLQKPGEAESRQSKC